MRWWCIHEWHVVSAQSCTIRHDDWHGHSGNSRYTVVSEICRRCGRTRVGVLRGDRADLLVTTAKDADG